MKCRILPKYYVVENRPHLHIFLYAYFSRVNLKANTGQDKESHSSNSVRELDATGGEDSSFVRGGTPITYRIGLGYRFSTIVYIQYVVDNDACGRGKEQLVHGRECILVFKGDEGHGDVKPEPLTVAEDRCWLKVINFCVRMMPTLVQCGLFSG